MNEPNNEIKGGLVISDDVIAAIAINAAKDVEGVSGFVTRQADFQKLLNIGSDSLKYVKVWTNENEIKLHLYIKIRNGVKIPEVAAAAQNSVKNAVQSMTGRIVTKVNISIAGIDFIEPVQIQN